MAALRSPPVCPSCRSLLCFLPHAYESFSLSKSTGFIDSHPLYWVIPRADPWILPSLVCFLLRKYPVFARGKSYICAKNTQKGYVILSQSCTLTDYIVYPSGQLGYWTRHNFLHQKVNIFARQKLPCNYATCWTDSKSHSNGYCKEITMNATTNPNT